MYQGFKRKSLKCVNSEIHCILRAGIKKVILKLKQFPLKIVRSFYSTKTLLRKVFFLRAFHLIRWNCLLMARSFPCACKFAPCVPIFSGVKIAESADGKFPWPGLTINLNFGGGNARDLASPGVEISIWREHGYGNLERGTSAQWRQTPWTKLPGKRFWHITGHGMRPNCGQESGMRAKKLMGRSGRSSSPSWNSEWWSDHGRAGRNSVRKLKC